MQTEIALFEKLQGEDIERGLYIRKFGVQVIFLSKVLTIAINKANLVHISWYDIKEDGCRGFEASLRTFCLHRKFITNDGISYIMD